MWSYWNGGCPVSWTNRDLAQHLHLFYYVDQMPRRNPVGNLDLIAMSALIRLGVEAYGVSISHEIKETTGSEVALGTIYAVLQRLEREGMVRSSLGEATPERGGRAKRYFRITAKGVREVNQMRRALGRLWRGVPELAGEKV
jgi:PadR family transcriptional regulator, regulatory protein PadR